MTNRVCYVLVHRHLSTIQKGVQAAHAVANLMWMAHEVSKLGEGKDILRFGSDEILEWAANEKTIILLDAGNSQSLLEWNIELNDADLFFVQFDEDYDTLCGMTTAMAFVVDKDKFLKSKKKAIKQLVLKLASLELAK